MITEKYGSANRPGNCPRCGAAIVWLKWLQPGFHSAMEYIADVPVSESRAGEAKEYDIQKHVPHQSECNPGGVEL